MSNASPASRAMRQASGGPMWLYGGADGRRFFWKAAAGPNLNDIKEMDQLRGPHRAKFYEHGKKSMSKPTTARILRRRSAVIRRAFFQRLGRTAFQPQSQDREVSRGGTWPYGEAHVEPVGLARPMAQSFGRSRLSILPEGGEIPWRWSSRTGALSTSRGKPKPSRSAGFGNLWR